MKSFNVDDKLKDREIIKEALVKVCKGKKKKGSKSKWKNPKTNKRKKIKKVTVSRKYKQAQYILGHTDEFVETIYEIVVSTEIVMKREMEDIFSDDEHNFMCFKHATPKIFIIKEGLSKKEREGVSIPLFPDQVIHQLIIEVGKPVFTRGMYYHSYGSIPGKGAHKGQKHIKKIINHHTKHDKSAIKYGAQLDITKCYQSFSHTYLKGELRKKFRGRLFLCFCFIIIDSYVYAVVTDPVTGEIEVYGLPIGYSTSQWFCNFGLTPLDYYIKGELHIEYYIRYVDDMCMFGRNKKNLHKAVKAINERLERIGMKLKFTWQVFRYDYIDKKGKKKDKRKGRAFDTLGLRFFRDKCILRKRNSLTIKRQVQKISNDKEVALHDAQSLMSRLGQLRHCNSYNFYQKHVKPFIDIKKLKGVIRNESRKQCKTCITV